MEPLHIITMSSPLSTPLDERNTETLCLNSKHILQQRRSPQLTTCTGAYSQWQNYKSSLFGNQDSFTTAHYMGDGHFLLFSPGASSSLSLHNIPFSIASYSLPNSDISPAYQFLCLLSSFHRLLPLIVHFPAINVPVTSQLMPLLNDVLLGDRNRCVQTTCSFKC